MNAQEYNVLVALMYDLMDLFKPQIIFISFKLTFSLITSNVLLNKYTCKVRKLKITLLMRPITKFQRNLSY